MRFTFGMPTHSDYDGPVFTSASLLAHHDRFVDEILIVDNHPASAQSPALQKWCEQHPKLRYVAAGGTVGTAPAKNAVFANAAGEMVVCLDSHELLFPGALEALEEFYAANPGATDDLVQGPLIYNDMTSASACLTDVWGNDGVWGQWTDVPERKTHKWFQITAQGTGLMACSKRGWLGFNENFRGFGGEERYIHEKFRRAGRKTWCVSGLRWWHRFGHPEPRKFVVSNRDKCRNYAIGMVELGMSLEPARERFVASGWVTPGDWAAIVAEAEDLNKKPSKGCGCKGGQTPTRVTPVVAPEPVFTQGTPVEIDELYAVAVKYPSDINEHLPKIRELAAECKKVAEFASGAATIALIAGVRDGSGHLTSYYHSYRADAPELYRLAGGEERFRFITGDSLEADIGPVDMLFVDSESTAKRLLPELEKHHANVSKLLVLHRTSTYGEYGSDGGPGMLPAVRQFLKTHREWFVLSSSTANNGLMVLCRDTSKKPKLPSKWKMLKNAAKALTKDVLTGMQRVSLEVADSRLSECMLCEHRVDDRCSLCGCYLETRPDGGSGKAWFSQEFCPIGKWADVQ